MNQQVDHAGKHLGLDFKRLAVELKLVNGVPAEGRSPSNVGRGGAKQSGGNPGEQVVAHEVESRHGVGFDASIQTSPITTSCESRPPKRRIISGA